MVQQKFGGFPHAILWWSLKLDGQENGRPHHSQVCLLPETKILVSGFVLNEFRETGYF